MEICRWSAPADPAGGGAYGEDQEKFVGTLMFFRGGVAYVEDAFGKVRLSAICELQFLDRAEFVLP